MCGIQRPSSYAFYTNQGWGASARARTCEPLFRISGTAGRFALMVCGYAINYLCISCMLRVGYLARDHLCDSFSYLGIHWMHHAEIWCETINCEYYTGDKWRTSTSAQVHSNILFKYICSLPLVYCPKGVLLVLDQVELKCLQRRLLLLLHYCSRSWYS